MADQPAYHTQRWTKHFEGIDLEIGQHRLGAFDRLGWRETEIERAEGDVLDHRRREQLVVGILEQETHPEAQVAEVILVVLVSAKGDNLTGLRRL